MKQIEWTITNNEEAPDPDLPSHFFPGCGNGKADFFVSSSNKVESKEEMKGLLQEYSDVAYLIYFDVSSQQGRFGLVDESAPKTGTVLKGEVWEEEDFHNQEQEWYQEHLNSLIEEKEEEQD